MFESLLQRRRPVSRVALSAAILVLSQSSYVTSASAQTLSPQVLNALKQAPKWMPPTYTSLIGVGIPNTLSQILQVGLVIPQTETDMDSSGVIESYQPGGATITGTNAFFQPLGTNGRTCATCHQPSNAMGMSTTSVKARLLTTLGTDPLFAPVDGANCPNTGGLPLLNQSGYSLLLNYGLIRIPLPVPTDAEYTISVASDPTGCNTNKAYNQAVDPTNGTTAQIISTYRRPQMAANLQFKVLSGVDTGGAPPVDLVTGEAIMKDPATGHFLNGNIMVDGREPTLTSQALDATLTHAQATTVPSANQLAQMVAFESGFFSAQSSDSNIGSLTSNGLTGGPVVVSQTPGGEAAAAGAQVFSNFNALNPASASESSSKQSIYRGQQLFNNLQFLVTDDEGINNALPSLVPVPGLTKGIMLTCASCHAQVNGGTETVAHGQHSIGIGGMNVNQGGPAPSGYLPLFKITCKNGATTPFNGTTVLVNDPGKALITGKCADIGRFSTPQMHGLTARAPYMHDGSQATLLDVVNFYDKRFSIGLTTQNKSDLVNFMQTL